MRTPNITKIAKKFKPLLEVIRGVQCDLYKSIRDNKTEIEITRMHVDEVTKRLDVLFNHLRLKIEDVPEKKICVPIDKEE